MRIPIARPKPSNIRSLATSGGRSAPMSAAAAGSIATSTRAVKSKRSRTFDCIAEDLSQCLCENGDDLNCEGAFKPNEGPAHCIAEHEQFERCKDDNSPANP